MQFFNMLGFPKQKDNYAHPVRADAANTLCLALRSQCTAEDFSQVSFREQLQKDLNLINNFFNTQSLPH